MAILRAAALALLCQTLAAAADEFPACMPRDMQGNAVKDSFGRTYDLSPLRVKSGSKYVCFGSMSWTALSGT